MNISRSAQTAILCLAASFLPINSFVAQAATVPAGACLYALDATAVQNEEATTQTMNGVVERLGGEAAWKGVRAPDEILSATKMDDKSSHIQTLKNYWSLDTTRYRRLL